VIGIRRKKLIRRFREAGATDSEHAATLESLGGRSSWIFNQMVEGGVFLRNPDGTYYMDDLAATECLHQQRRRALIFTGILVLAFLLLWAFGAFGR
jgi:hypothetical protein